MENLKGLKGILRLFPFEFELYFNSSLELIKLNLSFYLNYPKKELSLPHPSLENIFREFLREIKRYFEGKSSYLDLPHSLSLGPTSLKVIQLLREIPRGKILTYGELAKIASLPFGQRAVGQILAKNPLPLLYPCHRVISKKGISGFSQGVLLKWLLLYWERSNQLFDKKTLLKSIF